MEKYKIKNFAKWAKSERISDQTLNEILVEMESGLLGDRLGAHIYKKRIKIGGRGKSGGARVILIYRDNDLALFLYGYSKNEQENISDNELLQLRIFAKEFLSFSLNKRSLLVQEGKLFIVRD